jgi:D-alanyl-D-alanine carboxypeptidase
MQDNPGAAVIMDRRVIAFLLLTVLTIGCGGSSAACLPLQTALLVSTKEYAVSEASAAWLEDGQLLCAYAGDGVGSSSLFCIGSISKSFVTALALLLQEEGKISLQDTVGDYLPTFDYWNKDSVTLSDLLSMRSGIADYTATFEKADYFREYSANELIDLGLSHSSLLRRGEFHYSNTNILIAQQMIEAAAGECCEALIRQKILEPLGLQHTYFSREKDRVRPRLVRGYSDTEAASGVDFTDTTASWSGLACGMISTASDMAAWGDALVHGPLLSAESKDELLHFTDSSQGFGYGLCVAQETVYGTESVVLSGNVPGYGTVVYVTDNAALAVLCNRTDYSGSHRSYAEGIAETIMTDYSL